MPKKKNNIFFKILAILFLVYIALTIAYESGYYETKQKNRATLTKEAMEQFENDLKEGKTLDIKEYLTNIFLNSKGYLKGFFYALQNNKIKYVNINGKLVAIYKEQDREYKVYPKCPYMGCNLIFNEQEKTWDCPCHASRFSKDGKCLKGPSNKDITFKN